ncbi:MAG: M2 family metallopeptidase [Ignavibacteriae bacterium]|nr:M2 family metallopeptidase [Ignavibacteriota bacterium]
MRYLIIILMTTILLSSCGKKEQTHSGNYSKAENEFVEFVKALETKAIPIYKESNLAYWNASLTGKKEDFEKNAELMNKYDAIFADKASFEKIKKFKESGEIKDEILKREVVVLYNLFQQKQADTSKLNAINGMQNMIEQKYGNFRTEVGGQKLTDNQVEEKLTKSTDSKELKEVWLSQKKIGNVVADDVKKIVKMRNDLAKSMGFNNFHEMMLKVNEEDPEEISKLFDELDALTKDAFAKEKENIDNYFAERYKIKKEELMPWHYQNRFFQEAPKIYKVDFDKFYEGKKLEDITTKFYKSIGLPIEDMVKNSDLYEKPGKNQHAYCTDIDRSGDVRVLCNIVPNEKWMNTMLHEYGHAVYSKNIDKTLPFYLRSEAQTFCTEAIAMIMGRFSTSGPWLKDNLGISDEESKKVAEDGFKSLRLQQLVFSRWSQVMYRFEKSMYANPDQDLNKLWWDLVEKYQLLKKPEGRNEPDWATKIHIASFPCYYHNYLMGELLASQLYFYITKNVMKSEDYKNFNFTGKPEVGKYFTEKVFNPGLKYFWNDMIEKATGEKLTAKYYAQQFVK